MTTVPSLSAGAQASPPCTTAPCVRVAYEDYTGHLASDAKHFIYAPEGEEVEIGVYAEFTPAACTAQCAHGDRSVTWTVTGAPNYTVLNVDASIPYVTNNTAIRLNLGDAEAGDTITVDCAIGAPAPGECNEKKNGDLYQHTPNSHGGASAACTIKLWRLDLEADKDLDPVSGYPYYISQFASNVKISATAVGTSIYETDWTSIVDGNTLNEIENGSSSWSGKIVAPTDILCWATVWNQCDLLSKKLAIEDVSIDPSIRRPGWTTEVQLAGTDTDWLDTEPLAFPQVDWGVLASGEDPEYGRNANARTGYANEFSATVVPYYNDNTNFAADYSSFASMREEIASGPNEGLFFNTNNTMYEVNRRILSNHWINPGASHPATPATDNLGNSYTNWLDVFETYRGGPDCPCLSPSTHGGTGTAAFYRANLYHEGRGSPGSPNKRLLGHHSRLEDGYALGPRSVVDPVYRCDLLYASSEAGLRAQNEAQRLSASNNLLTMLGALHIYVASHPERHNFTGDVFIYTVAGGWHPLNQGQF